MMKMKIWLCIFIACVFISPAFAECRSISKEVIDNCFALHSNMSSDAFKQCCTFGSLATDDTVCAETKLLRQREEFEKELAKMPPSVQAAMLAPLESDRCRQVGRWDTEANTCNCNNGGQWNGNTCDCPSRAVLTDGKCVCPPETKQIGSKIIGCVPLSEIESFYIF
jgi:hypothetical protein